MSYTVLFIIGTLIFLSYLFFLLRMVWKQHQIQQEEESKYAQPILRKVEDETHRIDAEGMDSLNDKSMVS